MPGVARRFVELLLAVVTQARFAVQTVADHFLETQLAGLTQEILPTHHALAVFARRVIKQRFANVNVIRLKKVQIAIVVEIAKIDVGPGLVPFAVVVETAEVGNEIGPADILELTVDEVASLSV